LLTQSNRRGSSNQRLVWCIRLFDIISDYARRSGCASRGGSLRPRSPPRPSDRRRRTENASTGVVLCLCGRPVQRAGGQRSSPDSPRALPGTLPQGQGVDSRTTDTPLRHRRRRPVEGSVASTTRSDLPQNFIPGDAQSLSLLYVPVEVGQPSIQLCALL
jgi:hypothetical protein